MELGPPASCPSLSITSRGDVPETPRGLTIAPTPHLPTHSQPDARHFFSNAADVLQAKIEDWLEAAPVPNAVHSRAIIGP